MSEILETYQEEQSIKAPEQNSLALATITALSQNGIQVQFDGEQEPSTKSFAYNIGVEYQVGDRVVMVKVNGAYMVLCPFKRQELPPPIVSWADGTEEEITAMLDAHYRGVINIYDYWHVGDEKVVHLSAIAHTGTANGVTWNVDEDQAEKDVTLVLADTNKYELATGGMCAFVVEQKEVLSTLGRINSTNSNADSWRGCIRRNWCNGGYWNAMPIRSIYKKFKCITASKTEADKNIVTEDYFALMAEKEIFGSRTKSVPSESSALTQFAWHEGMSNILKLNGASYAYYWLRSPANDNATMYCYVTAGGVASSEVARGVIGFAPFGCI